MVDFKVDCKIYLNVLFTYSSSIPPSENNVKNNFGNFIKFVLVKDNLAFLNIGFRLCSLFSLSMGS